MSTNSSHHFLDHLERKKTIELLRAKRIVLATSKTNGFTFFGLLFLNITFVLMILVTL